MMTSLIHSKQIDIEKMPRCLWVNDSKTNQCNICNIQIKSGLFKSNKHHCRFCGHIVCSSCSDRSIHESLLSYLRVCDQCYLFKKKEYKNENKELKSTEINKKYIIIEDYTNYKTFTNDTLSHHNIIDKYWINRKDILVFGYIRTRTRTRHSSSSSKILIPNDIIQLLINWVYVNDEWQIFSDTDTSNLRITNSKQTIERISTYSHKCFYGFGSEVISSNDVQKWKININNISYDTKPRVRSPSSLLIGVIETYKIKWIKSQKYFGDFTYGAYNGYALNISNNKSYFIHKNEIKNIYFESGNLIENNIIIIKLDLKLKKNQNNNIKCGKLLFKFKENQNKDIKYGINDNYNWENNEKYVAFNDIDISKQYSLIIGMYSKNKVTFIESYN